MAEQWSDEDFMTRTSAQRDVELGEARGRDFEAACL